MIRIPGAFHLPAIVLSLLLFREAALLAQAWPRDSGKVYAKLSYGTSTASEQFSFDGRVKDYADNVPENAFFDRSLYFYGELGLTRNLTLVASVPYKRVIVRDAAFRYRTFALGDAQIGARYGLNGLLGLEGGSEAVAANVSVSLPLGYSRNLTPSAGSGQINADLNVSYGHSFYPLPLYAQGAFGYRYRSDIYALSTAIPCQEGVNKDCFADTKPSYDDELFGGMEAGVTIANRVLLQGIARFTWSLTQPDVGFSVANPIPTKQRFLKIGGGIGVAAFRGLGVSGQVFFTPTGRNTVNSVDLFLGIDYTFSLF